MTYRSIALLFVTITVALLTTPAVDASHDGSSPGRLAEDLVEQTDAAIATIHSEPEYGNDSGPDGLRPTALAELSRFRFLAVRFASIASGIVEPYGEPGQAYPHEHGHPGRRYRRSTIGLDSAFRALWAQADRVEDVLYETGAPQTGSIWDRGVCRTLRRIARVTGLRPGCY